MPWVFFRKPGTPVNSRAPYLSGPRGALQDKVKVPHPLTTEAVPIDDKCIGDRWTSDDETHLARLIAIIAMGQATHAAHILKELLPAKPAFTVEELKHEAIVNLTVQEEKQTPRTGYPRWQRDGFMFEAISWIAARQTLSVDALLKDPHINATSQGLDGLIIELSPDKAKIVRTTVFEDKCTEYPRKTFLEQVIPAFQSRHKNERAAELVATASVLLKTTGIDNAGAGRLAAAVMSRERRRYRAAFALTDEHDDLEKRRALFGGYDAVGKVSAEQLIAASFIVSGELREWFDGLAAKAISFLSQLEEDLG